MAPREPGARLNAYAVLIAAALVLEHGLALAADLLNLRALRTEVPEGFRSLYDAERYRRSQEYTRAKTRFEIVRASFDLAVLALFWAVGGFARLDGAARDLGFGPIRTGLVFIGALAFAKSVLALPFAWHATFVLEERFGFNQTTRRTFWLDVAKGGLLALALGAPLLAAILWFFERTGDAAWLWCWLATALFALFVQFVAPTWILPLFNTFRPLESSELSAAVLAYARRVAFPLSGLFVVDGSRRTTKANAFFTGFGKRKRIGLDDTLLAKHSQAELVAIVAHEIGHYKLGHVVKTLTLSILQAGVVFFLLSLALRQPGLYEAFGVGEPSTYAGLVFFALLYSPLDLALSLALRAVSRKNELEADAWARATIGDGESLACALERLSADALDNLTPHPLYVKLHYSHPPVPARVAALRA
jgi:STE24 endopeptidase